MSHLSHKVTDQMGNTKPFGKNTRARRWCFTWNNPTDLDKSNMLIWCKSKTSFYIFEEEIGEEKGTPHLQGYFEFKNATRFSTLKSQLPKINFRIAKGSKKQNIAYCSKSGTNVTQTLTWKQKLHSELLAEYSEINWKPWQKQIIKYLNSKPNGRDIMWVHESIGNIGKSFLTKYIVLKYQCIIADGKKDNIFNQVKISMDEEREPKIIILDIPRCNLEYVNYGALEQLKNGLIYSGKYEGGVCVFHYPHILVFANEAPKKWKMSTDRWIEIDLNKLRVVIETTSST